MTALLKFQRIAFILLPDPIHLLLFHPICVHTHSILLVVIRDPVPMAGQSFSPSSGKN